MRRRKYTAKVYPTREHADVAAHSRAVVDCGSCGDPYAPAESWQRTCPICFRESRQWEFKDTDVQFMALQGALHKAMAAAEKTTEKPIPPDIIRRLIMLCHPDRHENSREANELTGWLLDMRGRK